MKDGLRGKELGDKLLRQSKEKRDFIVDTAQVDMRGKAQLHLPAGGPGADLRMNDVAHMQVATRLGIPLRYYQRMLALEQKLLAQNVNKWLIKEPRNRMVRTIGGVARAFLSDRYRRLDNIDLLRSSIKPAFKALGGEPEIRSAAVTDRYMYIQAISEKMVAEIMPGDKVQAGVVISNSEVGVGSLRVEPMLLRLKWRAGIVSDESLRKHHIGRRLADEQTVICHELPADTSAEGDKQFWIECRELIKQAFDRKHFDRLVKLARAAAEAANPHEPAPATEAVAKANGLTDKERGSFFDHLINGKDLSQWGFSTAAVSVSRDDGVGYDRAVDLQRVGGKILGMDAAEFKKLGAETK